MSDNDFDIHYIAQLARLALTPEEEKTLGSQLVQVLGYIDKLKELDVSDVEPMSHAIPLVNVTRSDDVRPGLATEDALLNAPSASNNLFMVPKIVE